MVTDWWIGVLRRTGVIVAWPRKGWPAAMAGVGVAVFFCVDSLWLREFVFFPLAIVSWWLGQVFG